MSSIFSKLAGTSTLKQTRRTCVSGYDSGRSLSYSSCPAVSHSANSTVLPDAVGSGMLSTLRRGGAQATRAVELRLRTGKNGTCTTGGGGGGGDGVGG